jgi:hypothetical protein
MRTIRKSATEEILEGFDWSARIEGGLVSSSWSVPHALTSSLATYDNTSTSILISGGAVDNQYLVTNTVEDSKGQVFQRSFKVQVVDR